MFARSAVRTILSIEEVDTPKPSVACRGRGFVYIRDTQSVHEIK